MKKSLAQIAYEAVGEEAARQGSTQVGAPFHMLPPDCQNQWRAAAFAVRDEVVEALKILWN
jgi:hypothetical protein